MWGPKAREGTEAMSLAFVLLDCQPLFNIFFYMSKRNCQKRTVNCVILIRTANIQHMVKRQKREHSLFRRNLSVSPLE